MWFWKFQSFSKIYSYIRYLYWCPFSKHRYNRKWSSSYHQGAFPQNTHPVHLTEPSNWWSCRWRMRYNTSVPSRSLTDQATTNLHCSSSNRIRTCFEGSAVLVGKLCVPVVLISTCWGSILGKVCMFIMKLPKDYLCQKQPLRVFSKISVHSFQEHLFLEFSRRINVFNKQIPIFQESFFSTEQITVFKEAFIELQRTDSQLPGRYLSENRYFSNRSRWLLLYSISEKGNLAQTDA